MSNIFATRNFSDTTCSRRSSVVRFALAGAAALATLISAPQTSSAQTLAPVSKWELRVSSGAFVPAGNQRNSMKDAQATAAQLSWLVRPSLALTGTFTWARSRDIASLNDPKLDVFTSDVGVEARPAKWHANRTVSFSPFVGVGGGARSYNYRKLDVNATNNLAGYASIGGEIGVRRVGVRIEARDYATGFRTLADGAKANARNDVMIMAALRFNRHVAP